MAASHTGRNVVTEPKIKELVSRYESTRQVYRNGLWDSLERTRQRNIKNFMILYDKVGRAKNLRETAVEG